MSDPVELFGRITNILNDCKNQLNNSFPKDGPDMVFIGEKPNPVKEVSGNGMTLQVKAFEGIKCKIDEAYRLVKELDPRSLNKEIDSCVLIKLNKDICLVHTIGYHFYNDAVSALKGIPLDSPGADIVRLVYKQAVSLYVGLHVFVRKAKPKKLFSVLNRLKPLPSKF
jgi:hypothetical protein